MNEQLSEPSPESRLPSPLQSPNLESRLASPLPSPAPVRPTIARRTIHLLLALGVLAVAGLVAVIVACQHLAAMATLANPGEVIPSPSSVAHTEVLGLIGWVVFAASVVFGATRLPRKRGLAIGLTIGVALLAGAALLLFRFDLSWSCFGVSRSC